MTPSADKRLRRVLTLVVCAAVLVLACQVAAHWHNSDHNDSQCQMCHLSHTTSFLLGAVAQLPQPAVVTASTSRQPAERHQKQYLSQGDSRAPPVYLLSA